MNVCSSCGRDIPGDRLSCPNCGTTFDNSHLPTLPLDDDSHDALVQHSGRLKDAARSPRSPASFDSIDDARFVPGTMLAGRYRIVGLLGKGGMGEVYRADDLKLGQPVALKFLPDALSQDGAALARFHREVRVARQVSHRNVCRVYDIGEIDGHHFLSMEYIKGEELASLIRRIGRLPADKATEIARQLCAGLAAAHDNNVLHRDLKPANVMIDENGNVRVTDFGLAGLVDEFRDDEMRAGTPAYMAPEQLEGKEVTVRSDIYSLGLVLYEVFTGKRAFDAASVAELVRLRRSATTPTNPSSLVKEIDPLAERVILRCLEREPEARPASALQVAAALPGGDPIAAALAAGETPSPEMIAAAPKEGSLRPAVAVGLLASFFVLLAVAIFAAQSIMLHRLVPLEKSPDVLYERANEIAKRLGYNIPPKDSAYGFRYDGEYLAYLREYDRSRTRWNNLASGQPSAIPFWYRQSPIPFETYSGSTASDHDPPNLVPGMILMNLDTTGRLFYFEAVPAQSDEAQNGNASATPDWSIFFKEAGLEMASFQETDSKWTPPHASDARAAWTGVYPNAPQLPIRIEAASYRGKPVYFEIINPWRKPSVQGAGANGIGDFAFNLVLFGIFLGSLFASSLLAWKNWRLGRGDRKGAFRVALFLLVIRMLAWVFGTHHTGSLGELDLLLTGLESALFWSCFVGIMYLALEPFLRRRWPERTIAWSRLLAGAFRDPLVGRDILLGAVFGMILMLSLMMAYLAPKLAGLTPNLPFFDSSTHLLGTKSFLIVFMNQISATLAWSFIFTFILLFLTILLRKDWLGIAAGWIVLSALAVLVYSRVHPLGTLFGMCTTTLYVIIIRRYGLLVMIFAMFFFHLIIFFPITTELSAWYAGDFVIDLVILIALAVYGFYTSLAGQPLMKRGLLED